MAEIIVKAILTVIMLRAGLKMNDATKTGNVAETINWATICLVAVIMIVGWRLAP